MTIAQVFVYNNGGTCQNCINRLNKVCGHKYDDWLLNEGDIKGHMRVGLGVVDTVYIFEECDDV